MPDAEEALLGERSRSAAASNAAVLVAVGMVALLVIVFTGLWVRNTRPSARPLQTAYGPLRTLHASLEQPAAERTRALRGRDRKRAAQENRVSVRIELGG